MTKRQKYEQKAKAFITKQLAGQVFKRAVVAALAAAGITVGKTGPGIVFGVIWPKETGGDNDDFGFSSKDKSLYVLKKPSYPKHQP